MAGRSQAHLDVLARQLGFRDYATYQAYQQHRAQILQGNWNGGTPAPQPVRPPVQQPPPRNWLQSVFGRISDAFTGAGQ